MRPNELRKHYKAVPFRPFTLRTSDEREFRVAHPESMLLNMKGRSVIVLAPDGDYDIIDMVMIVSIRANSGYRRRDSGGSGSNGAGSGNGSAGGKK